jgi:hypothetical protein
MMDIKKTIATIMTIMTRKEKERSAGGRVIPFHFMQTINYMYDKISRIDKAIRIIAYMFSLYPFSSLI